MYIYTVGECGGGGRMMMSAKQSQFVQPMTNLMNYNWDNLFSDGAGMNLCSRQPEDDTLMLPSGTEIEVKPPESCLWPNAMQVNIIQWTNGHPQFTRTD